IVASPTRAPPQDTEEWVDRFATLFSPPTPRASPTNTPAPLLQFDSPRSPDSEFGAFVSVLPSQDPLTTTPFPPTDAEPSTQHMFFSEAIRAHERNKQEVLDELLHNEDHAKDSHNNIAMDAVSMNLRT
ncbi:hypothetical protein IW261DRAFT_1344989, partial [Armillaria novae-zelandiae]